MAKPDREVPPPLEGNARIITATGTVAWAIALIVVFTVRHDLPPSSHWWIWTCAAGFGMGLFGLVYVPHLQRSRARSAAKRESAG